MSIGNDILDFGKRTRRYGLLNNDEGEPERNRVLEDR